MFERIKKKINLYKNGFGYQDVKVVMTTTTFEKLKEEFAGKLIFNEEEKDPVYTICGCPIEIYDKIIVDFYVTQIINVE